MVERLQKDADGILIFASPLGPVSVPASGLIGVQAVLLSATIAAFFTVSSHAYVCVVLYGAMIVSLMILFLRNWPSSRPEPNIVNRDQASQDIHT